MKIKDLEQPKARNFVAKHSQSKSGAGVHKSKKGKGSYRKSDRKNWKKDMKEALQGDFIPFNEDISAQVARDLYRSAGGDLDRARKVATYFHQKVLAHMEQHHSKQQTKKI